METSNEYLQQAMTFLTNANATMKIEFAGYMVNKEWNEKDKRAMYQITLATPRGSMMIDFWDSIHDTEIRLMTPETFAQKRYKLQLVDMTPAEKAKMYKELKAEKAKAKPNEYDILACITHSDPGTFEDFCSDFGYDEDSRRAERIYFAVQKEYVNLTRIFTPKQMEELAEIN